MKAFGWYSIKAEPWNSLPPVLVTAKEAPIRPGRSPRRSSGSGPDIPGSRSAGRGYHTEVLSEHATMVDRVLEAHAVQQDVDVRRADGARLDLRRTARRDLHAGGECGEAQEVALVLRQVLDLRRRDVGRDRLRQDG